MAEDPTLSPAVNQLIFGSPSEDALAAPTSLSVRRPWLKWVAAALGVVCLIALIAGWVTELYGASWHLVWGDSDNANAVLIGNALAHGNLLLHGWTLPPDSYWSIDLPFYAIFTAAEGIRPALMHQVPVLLDVALVVLGATCAGRGFVGWGKWTAATTTFLVLGLPSAVLASYLLVGPQHVGTALFCLAAFLALSRDSLVARAIGILVLGAAVVGDPVAVAVGVVPVGLAGLATAWGQRRWQSGLSAGGGALGALGLAEVVKYLIRLGNGYATSALVPLATPSQWPSNIRYSFVRLWDMLAGQAAVPTGWGGLSMSAHLLGTTVVAIGVVGGSGRLVRDVALRSQNRRASPSIRQLEDMLVIGVWGSMATNVLVRAPSGRYLLPGLAFAVILGGRFLGAAAIRLRPRQSLTRVMVPGLIALLTIGYVSSFISLGRLPPPLDPQPILAQRLAAQGLHEGVGVYFDASIITVDSDNKVRVHPVLNVNGVVRLFGYQSEAPPSGPLAPRFLVYTPSQPWGGVDTASASHAFGPPSSSWRVGPYQVLIWNHAH